MAIFDYATSEICVHLGIDSVENLVANRGNCFINRYGESVSHVLLVRFVCIFLLRSFNFCLLYLFSATIQDGEIKLYAYIYYWSNLIFFYLACLVL